MSSPPKSDTERLGALDALRGLAAFGVMLTHYVGYLHLMKITVSQFSEFLIWLVEFGHQGVPMFFVLSGYVITRSSNRYTFDQKTAARFLLRRLVRLLPPLWIMIAIHASSVAIGHELGLFRNTHYSTTQVVANLFGLQNLFGYPSIDVAYWTLCLELQFYIFYTLLAVLFRRSAERWQLLGFALTVLTSVFLDFFAVGSVHMFLRMWYPFGLGVLVYFVGKNWGRWWAMSPLMICVLTVAICGVLQERSTSVTPAVVAVLLLLQQHYQAYLRPAPRILLRLGRCSYSIFLVHGFLGLALGVLFRRGVLTTELTAWCGIVVFIVLALLCAELYHHFIEKRFAALAARIPVCVDRPKIPIPPLNSSEAVTPNPDSSGSPPKP